MSRRQVLQLAIIPWISLVGIRTIEAGERFLLGPPDSGNPVCSILVPTGWYPTASSGESDGSYRFVFEPVKGSSPTIILDINENTDLDAFRESWRQRLSPLGLLEGTGSGHEYYDADRQLAWRLASTERASSVTVTVLKQRLYKFRFVDTEKASDSFKTAVQEIVDSCDFKAETVPAPPTSRAQLVKMFADTETIPFQLKYQDLIGVTGLEWKLGIAVGTVLFSLAGIERFLRARKDAQRIADAEAAIEARETAERSGGTVRQSLLEPENPPHQKRMRRKRLPN